MKIMKIIGSTVCLLLFVQHQIEVISSKLKTLESDLGSVAGIPRDLQLLCTQIAFIEVLDH